MPKSEVPCHVLGLFYHASISQVQQDSDQTRYPQLDRRNDSHRAGRSRVVLVPVQFGDVLVHGNNVIESAFQQTADRTADSIPPTDQAIRYAQAEGARDGMFEFAISSTRECSRRAKRLINVSNGSLATALTHGFQTREQARRIPTTTTHGLDFAVELINSRGDRKRRAIFSRFS